MHAHTDLEFRFANNNVDLDLVYQVYDIFASVVTDVDVGFHDFVLSFEESYRLVWFEDLVDVAKMLARVCKGKVGFTMSGTIDTSESAGEYMDYQIEFKDDVLYAQNSGWYLMYYGTDAWDDDYDEFCEEFDKPDDIDKDIHTYSEEFFNALKDNEEWYTTNGFGCDLEIWLDGIHMGEPTVIAYD